MLCSVDVEVQAAARVDRGGVLDRDRVVEVLLLLDVVDRLLGGERIDLEPAERIPDRAHAREDQEARHNQHRNAVENSPKYVGQHLVDPFSTRRKTTAPTRARRA